MLGNITFKGCTKRTARTTVVCYARGEGSSTDYDATVSGSRFARVRSRSIYAFEGSARGVRGLRAVGQDADL